MVVENGMFLWSKIKTCVYNTYEQFICSLNRAGQHNNKLSTIMRKMVCKFFYIWYSFEALFSEKWSKNCIFSRKWSTGRFHLRQKPFKPVSNFKKNDINLFICLLDYIYCSHEWFCLHTMWITMREEMNLFVHIKILHKMYSIQHTRYKWRRRGIGTNSD